jgi:hypothetical protein
VRVFYDADEAVPLWGKDLTEELTAFYAELMALAEDPQWCSANFPTWLMVRLSG